MSLDKYRGLFVSESEAHLEALSKGVLELEHKGDDGEHSATAIHEVFRHVHSLKGMAATMGFDDLSAGCHELETLMSDVREKKRTVEKDLIELLLFGCDQISLFVAAVRDRADPPSLSALVDRARAVAGRGATQLIKEVPLVIETGALALKVYIEERSATPALRAFLAAKRLQAALGPALEQSPSADDLKRGSLPGLCLTLAYSALIDEAKVSSAIAGLSDIARYEIVPVVPQAAEPAKPRETSRSIRVRTVVLDELLDAAGELLIAQSRVEAALATSADTEGVRALEIMRQAVRTVHVRAMALRTVPFATVAERYPRVVRDAAGATGKLVELQIVGHELELDRAVLEAIDSALVHLLRNAVDHGIEAPEKRGRKPSVGTITIKAERDRDAIAISIEDDGAGTDEAKLRSEAVRRGMTLPPGKLSPAQMMRLLTMPGFSTKAAANQISGRGVGLDAVQDAVDALGGSIELQTEVPRYTRMILRLPPSIAVLPVLRVACGALTLGIPLRRVLATEDLDEPRVKSTGDAVLFRGAPIPVFSLSRLLEQEAVDEERWIVVVEGDVSPVALRVSKVLDVREAVTKKLGPPLSRMRIFDSATVLGDGRPMMILDVVRLIGDHGLASAFQAPVQL